MHSKVEKKFAPTRYRPSATFHHPVPAVIKPDELKQPDAAHLAALPAPALKIRCLILAERQWIKPILCSVHIRLSFAA